MPYTNPQRLRGTFKGVTAEDGSDGYLVTHHWYLWARMLIVAATSLGGVSAILLTADAAPAVRAALIFTVCAAFGWWAAALHFDRILVTRENLHTFRLNALWPEANRLSLRTPLQAKFVVHSRVLGVKRIEWHGQGDRVDFVYLWPAGGATMERAIQSLTASAT